MWSIWTATFSVIGVLAFGRTALAGRRAGCAIRQTLSKPGRKASGRCRGSRHGVDHHHVVAEVEAGGGRVLREPEVGGVDDAALRHAADRFQRLALAGARLHLDEGDEPARASR